MIEGLKLRVTSSELRKHCQDRSDYHRQRADEKEATLPELRKSLEALKTSPRAAEALARMTGKGSSVYHLDPDSPVDQLESDIRDHHQKALVFEFFATHLFDEDYTLQEADLLRLEIIRR